MQRNFLMPFRSLILIIFLATLWGCSASTREISIEQIGNMLVHAPQYDRDVQLTDGKYEGGEGSDFLSVSLEQHSAIGDLDKDGIDEAVVLLAENGGGSGIFVSLVVFQVEGDQIVQGPSYYIDDRPIVNSLSIAEGILKLDVTIHGPADPMVNPTLRTVQRLKLEGQRLVLIKLCSFITADTERSIVIDSPVDGQQVGATVQIIGSMPVGPFENNLALSVLDVDGNTLLVAPFMVDAPDMGAPATFDNTINLSAIPGGQTVRIVLTDVSMADGSTICMNSVEVMLP